MFWSSSDRSLNQSHRSLMPNVADDIKSVPVFCSFYGNVWEESRESVTVLSERTSTTRTDDVSVARANTWKGQRGVTDRTWTQKTRTSRVANLNKLALHFWGHRHERSLCEEFEKFTLLMSLCHHCTLTPPNPPHLGLIRLSELFCYLHNKSTTLIIRFCQKLVFLFWCTNSKCIIIYFAT